MTKPIVGFLAAVLLVVASAGAVFGYLAWDFMSTPGSAENKDVIYEVLPSKSFMAVARDLELAGVIKSASAFNVYARLTGERSRLKVGEYLLRTEMTPGEVIGVITSGRSVAKAFTVSEGLNIFDIALLVERAGIGSRQEFLGLVRDPAFVKSLLGDSLLSLEGYLYPETYQVTKFMGLRGLIVAMVRRFEAVWADIEKDPAFKGWNRHQLVTFASLIEKETGAAFERPMISSVFHNRVRKKMRLQTDPTILYGIALESGEMPKNISRADLTRPTPYNTYVIPGMPPGPIANPGRDSMLAAMRPAQSDYIFFVSKNDGTHVFSVTYEDHNKAVRAFQIDPRAREGKSWRDLDQSQRARSSAQ